MTETVEFASNGGTASGSLAIPASTPAPAVLVLQEWWGILPQIERVCDRLAAAGFVALVPDLYHGEIAEHTEMDRANELMSAMPPERAARDMHAAIDYLLGHDAVRGDAVGVVGFCMGGMLTLIIAAQAGDRVAAAVPYYGAPIFGNAPDWSGLTASVMGHFTDPDEFFAPGPVREVQSELEGLGKDVTFHWYHATGHAFANEDDPLGHYDEKLATQAWDRTVAFLREKLG
jgi:carboxymethylenebutenolidase